MRVLKFTEARIIKRLAISEGIIFKWRAVVWFAWLRPTIIEAPFRVARDLVLGQREIFKNIMEAKERRV